MAHTHNLTGVHMSTVDLAVQAAFKVYDDYAQANFTAEDLFFTKVREHSVEVLHQNEDDVIVRIFIFTEGHWADDQGSSDYLLCAGDLDFQGQFRADWVLLESDRQIIDLMDASPQPATVPVDINVACAYCGRDKLSLAAPLNPPVALDVGVPVLCADCNADRNSADYYRRSEAENPDVSHNGVEIRNRRTGQLLFKGREI